MKRILIIGATSAIAEHYARIEAGRGSAIFLVGRDSGRLQAIAEDLIVRGVRRTATRSLDLTDIDGHDAMLDEAWSAFDGIDVALVAHGTLPDQAVCDEDPAWALTEFATNATSTISLMMRIAARLRRQGSGTLAVISSVAGDRGRASNCLYGGAKAAVTAYASGLRQRLAVNGVNVLTIKPGFVDTPMTKDFHKGFLWVGPSTVARGIAAAIDHRRAVVYLPWFWRPIMGAIRHIPEFLFRRMKL